MGAPEGYDRKEFLARIGTFFLLVGIGLLVFFVLSEAAKKVTFDFFCWGLVLVIVGIIFRNQFKRTVPPSGRFSILKNFRSKKEDSGKK